MATDDQAYPPGVERPNCGPVVAPATGSEIERLRKRNSELQRRCQQAESAVIKFKADWDKAGGPRGGSFGRALLASYCQTLSDALETLRANCIVTCPQPWGHNQIVEFIDSVIISQNGQAEPRGSAERKNGN